MKRRSCVVPESCLWVRWCGLLAFSDPHALQGPAMQLGAPPDCVAIVEGDHHITGSRLQAFAHELEGHLRCGVEPASFVGVPRAASGLYSDHLLCFVLLFFF